MRVSGEAFTDKDGKVVRMTLTSDSPESVGFGDEIDIVIDSRQGAKSSATLIKWRPGSRTDQRRQHKTDPRQQHDNDHREHKPE